MNRFLPSLRAFLVASALLALPLLLLFREGFAGPKVLRANDTPFGLLTAQSDTAHEAFTGHWRNLNWVGRQEIEALPVPTQAAFFGLGSPAGYAKWHAPLGLLFLGLSAWAYCRRAGFHPAVGIVSGIAASLSADPFSYACWGLTPQAYAQGFVLLALAALQPGAPGWRRWVRVVLAGFAVGMNVSEGADVGAIFSLFVAGSVAFETLMNTDRKPASLAMGAVQLVIIAVTAAWIGAQAIQSITGYAVKDIQGMDPAAASSAERWEYITALSFPKIETLRLAVPGLFGYLTVAPDASAYWGGVGFGDMRSSASGAYVGIVVLLVAAWGVSRSLRGGPDSPYTEAERRRIWFWTGAAVLALMISFGKFFPLFRLVFALPFLSTIRIPVKYLHVVAVCVVVLFAHGLEGLGRAYLRPTARDLVSGAALLDRVKRWWTQATGHDRVWKRISLVCVLGGVVATVLYAGAGGSVTGHLTSTGFPAEAAREIYRFSVREVWVALGFLLAGTALLVVMAARGFRNTGAAWWCLGLLVSVDLYRSVLPWVTYLDKDWMYQTNPVIDLLKTGTADHSRVTARLHPEARTMLTAREDRYLPAVHNLWLEHHFQFYHIPTLDIIQMPRRPKLDAAYLAAFTLPDGRLDPKRTARLWQLTSTRYLIGALPAADQLNSLFAPPGTAFKPVLPFRLQPKSGVSEAMMAQPDSHTAAVSTNGPYAVFEFTGALPRASWIPRWAVESDDARTLERILSPDFNPTRDVVVTPAPEGVTPATEAGSGEATLTELKPRQVTVKTKATQAGMVLLNDRWHESWHAEVDGKPVPLLRANYIMRAVAVPAGEHTVRFRYDPPHGTLWVSLSAMAVGALLLLALAFAPAGPSETPRPA